MNPIGPYLFKQIRQPLELTCESTDGHSVEFHWSRNTSHCGRTVLDHTNSSRDGFHVDNGSYPESSSSRLTKDAVGYEDDGVYTCSSVAVSAGGSTAQSHAQLTLVIVDSEYQPVHCSGYS